MAHYASHDELLLGDQRNLGLYIAGMPGGGKTTLIQNLALADIRNGLGVCIIDPTGGLLEGLIHHLPQERVDKGEIILFDTSDPIPIDFFSYQGRDERRVLTDMIVSMFELADTKLLKPLLMEELGTLFDANDNPHITDKDRCTLLDLAYFLKDPDRRRTIRKYVPSRQTNWAWLDKVKNPDAEFESILRRLTYYAAPDILSGTRAIERNVQRQTPYVKYLARYG